MTGLVPTIPLRQRKLYRDHRDAVLRTGPVMTTLYLREPARHVVHALDAILRDQHHLAGLHPGLVIPADDIWLDHHRHPRAKRLVWHRSGRPAGRTENGRQ